MTVTNDRAKYTAVRLGDDDYEKLRKIAEADDRTIAYIIRKAIKEFLDKYEEN